MAKKESDDNVPGFLRPGDAEKIFRGKRFDGFRSVMGDIARQLRNDFQSSERIKHDGDRGEEREQFVKRFLKAGYFPDKYSVSKGHAHVISSEGRMSKQMDVLLYDGFQCPVLRDGESHQYLPIESVYGAIQVKSRLSKDELVGAAENLASMKRLARSGSVVRRHQTYSGFEISVGDDNPIPLGAVFAYSLADNSLESLAKNLEEYHRRTDPKEWVNLVCVLDAGIIYNDLGLTKCLDSRDIIKHHSKKLWCVPRASLQGPLLEFYLNLIGALGRIDLLPPPLEDYVDLPIVVGSDHTFKMGGFLAAWSCTKHGLYEPMLTEAWVNKIAEFVKTAQPVEPAKYLAAIAGGPTRIEGGLETRLPSRFVYTAGGVDPLPLLRTKFGDDGRPYQEYWEFEVNGRPIYLPMVFVQPDEPLFAACPHCPSGTPPVVFGGLGDQNADSD